MSQQWTRGLEKSTQEWNLNESVYIFMCRRELENYDVRSKYFYNLRHRILFSPTSIVTRSGSLRDIYADGENYVTRKDVEMGLKCNDMQYSQS